MKRLLALLLLGAMLAGFAGCGLRRQTSVEEDRELVSTPTPVETPIPMETDNGNTLEIETPVETSTPEQKLGKTLSYEMRTEAAESPLSDGTIYYRSQIKYPYFSGNSALETALNQHYVDAIETAKDTCDSIDADQEYTNSGLDPAKLPFYEDTSAEVVFQGRGAISIKEVYSVWSGGAHVYHYEAGLTYDLNSGEKLTFRDILDGTDAEVDSVLQYYFAQSLWTPSADELTSLKESTAFTLCGSGLRFYYNYGDAAPRAEITIPYTSDSSYVISVGDLDI